MGRHLKILDHRMPWYLRRKVIRRTLSNAMRPTILLTSTCFACRRAFAGGVGFWPSFWASPCWPSRSCSGELLMQEMKRPLRSSRNRNSRSVSYLLTALHRRRSGTTSAADALTYGAGFRHSREHSSYERVMAALDFTSPAGNLGFGRVDRSDGAPAFFSGNIASLSRVLSRVAEIRVTEEQRGAATVQTVLYQMGQ
jgi:hypothetical protein